MKIYLAGGIANLSDEEIHGWRDYLMSTYPEYTFLDPTRRDYRDIECTEAVSRIIVKTDKANINQSDVVVVRAFQPSWGTSQELLYAYERDKYTVVVTDAVNPSPWLVHHADFMVKDFGYEFDQILKRVARDLA